MRKLTIKFLIILSVVILIFNLSACGDKEYSHIISLVDDTGEYAVIDIKENKAYPKGHIDKLFVNDNKYIFYIVAYNGYNSDLDIVILVDNHIIKDIKGYNIQETPNVGTKAFEDSYINQFIGKDIRDYNSLEGSSKPNNDYDILYVTGATISSRAVLSAINITIEYYNNHILL